MKIEFIRLKEEHLDRLMNWRMSSRVTEFLLTDPKLTSVKQRQWYEEIRNDVTIEIWIVRVDGQDVGYFDLKDINFANKSADPGMYICEDKYLGKGLGRYIMFNIHDYAFGILKLNKLYGPVMSGNYPALVSYMKCGWKIDGIMRDHVRKHGRYQDLIMISILSRDWYKRRDDFEYPKVFLGSNR